MNSTLWILIIILALVISFIGYVGVIGKLPFSRKSKKTDLDQNQD